MSSMDDIENETKKEECKNKYYESNHRLRASTSINFNSIFICFLHAIQFNTINGLCARCVQLSEHRSMMRFLSGEEENKRRGEGLIQT
jgi:hypothetical protein